MNKEDITYEYEKYFLNLMKESKTNLYTRAGGDHLQASVFFQHMKEKGDVPWRRKTICGSAAEAADRFYLFFLDNYDREKMQSPCMTTLQR